MIFRIITYFYGYFPYHNTLIPAAAGAAAGTAIIPLLSLRDFRKQ